MSCFSPWAGQWLGEYTSNGKRKISITSPYQWEIDKDDPNVVYVPCGKCVGCRLDYARRWSDRLILELDHSKKACFITMTYNDDSIPYYVDESGEVFFTLHKPDVSTFMKDLRGRKEFLGKEIRFFCAGEYGDQTHRPHYHMILFGVDMDYLSSNGDVLTYHGTNELKQPHFSSRLLEDIWDNGYVQVGEATYQSMNYVARYTLKKAFGDDYTCDKPIQDEFTLMSRRPGIGFYYAMEHTDQIRDLEKIKIGKQEIYWPSYLLEKALNEDEMKKVKESRAEAANESINQMMADTDLSFRQQLNVALTKKINTVKILSRRGAI